MINRILMELYDDYLDTSNVDKLWDFANKTFPKDGTDKLFVGCTLILFSHAGIYKPRYFCTRENLVSVVLLAKEKIEDKNLLFLYITKVNKAKKISKILNDVINDPNLEQYADLIISYLDQFKWAFTDELKKINAIKKIIKEPV